MSCVSGSAAMGNFMTKPGLSMANPDFHREDAEKFGNRNYDRLQ